MKTILAALLALLLGAQAQAATVSHTLSITVQTPSMALIVNPSVATIACETAGGTLVSMLSTTGGNGGAVTFSMAPSASLSLAPNGQITVTTAGVAAADCGKTTTLTVSAAQAGGGAVSSTLTVAVQAPSLVVTLTPPSAMLPCAAPAGTFISQASVTGGGVGGTVSYTMTPADPSFAIDKASGLVSVAPGGIVPTDCTGIVENFTISATPN